MGGPKHPVRIIIPQLQRDYAQGREEKKELRERFLRDIFVILNNPNAQERIYDFVYGKSADEYEFYPVDGQQRLTTFFLLHIYIGKRADEDLSFLYQTTKDGSTECNFSYEARDSSKLFCQKLCEIDSSDYADIISYIEDQQWYTGDWEADPTIKSMMTMLDAIQNLCIDVADTAYFKSLWKNLTEKIKFWMLPLEELKSSDALYIKMNSRGKHLSDFENFKAEVEGILSEDSSHIQGSFAKEIDTTWTNVFWAYRNSDYDFNYRQPGDLSKQKHGVYSDNGLDDRMLAFLRNFLTLYGVRARIFSCSGEANTLSDIEIAQKVLRRRPQVARLLTILLDFISTESQASTDNKIESFFSRFLTTESEQSRYKQQGVQNTYLVNVNMDRVGCRSIDLFEIFMSSSNPTLQQKLLDYAFFVWVIAKNQGQDITDKEFKDRLRILRNLIANSYLHDDSDSNHTPLRETMKGVEILIKYGIKALHQNKKDEFAGPQKDQELVKSTAMKSNSLLAVLIPQLENHTMLRGNLSQLMPVTDVVLIKFREIFHEGCNLDEIESALLTYGDYSRIDGARRMYGGTNEKFWRDYLMQNANAQTSSILVKALADPSFTSANLTNLVQSYMAFCSSRKSYDWKYYISVYPEIRDIPRGVYRIEDGKRYSYFMCNASGNLMGNEKYWNPYNWTLKTLFPDSSIGGWGSSLHIGDYYLNVAEDYVEIHINDQLFCSIKIPQTSGVDNVDRIMYISALIPVLQKASAKCIRRFVKLYPMKLETCEYQIDFIDTRADEGEKVNS